MHVAIVVFPDDHVARQQKADFLFRRDRLEREWRIAGAEDSIARHVLVQFFLHFCRDVDVRQYSEAFGGENGSDFVDGLIEVKVHSFAESIVVVHRIPQSLLVLCLFVTGPRHGAINIVQQVNDLLGGTGGQ